jgi:predicted acyl esterase
VRHLAAVLLTLLLATPAAAEVVKETHRVPVRVGGIEIDTDVYLPDGPAPKRGRPLVVVFHGGGSTKDNGFDAGHARYFAEHGYGAVIYSQRGHGTSGGLTTVAGPDEMHDLFDVVHWALEKYGFDARRIALAGYSQGGLNTNLAQVWAGDREINPYGIRFRALEPGNTPDYVAEALVPDGVVKLSFGAGLIGTYYQGANGHVSPLLDKWIGTAAADGLRPAGADLCETEPHDTLSSSSLADLAVRSVGCFAGRMTPAVHWAQAFDDMLFTSDMAVSMWRRMPRRKVNRLYLSMGGHAAPTAPDTVEEDKLRAQLAFLDHALRGRKLRLPRVTYWTRDPAVQVSSEAFRWPDGAWIRHTARSWPPRGVRATSYEIPAAGALAGTDADPGSDGVVQTLAGGTTFPAGAAGRPAFATPAFTTATELSGRATLRLRWTPLAPDTQLAVKVFDRAPDGTLTLLARGVAGLRGATPGQERTLTVRTNDFSVLARMGHAIVATIAAGDASFYKPFPGSPAGGLLGASAIALPVRTT